MDRRDLPLIQTMTMVTVIGFALGNLIAELLCAALNPRVRLQS
jgi:ABC-type dipeptide/oligopeptide/nickel transport system permease component